MNKRIISVLLIFTMLLTGSVFCNAAVVVPEVDTVQPMYTYAKKCSAELSISDDVATYKATLTGYNSVTKVTCKITLQKKSLFSWSDVDGWTVMQYGTSFSTSKTAEVSSGKYRARAVFTVYSGTNTEEITVYSSTVSC